MKTTQMRKQRLLIHIACYSTGLSHHHLPSAETQKQAEEGESYTVRRKAWLQGLSIYIHGHRTLKNRNQVFVVIFPKCNIYPIHSHHPRRKLIPIK
jgi:hypothetical protein